MLEKKDHVKRIQEITFEAYKSSGRIAALLDRIQAPRNSCLRNWSGWQLK